MPLDHDPSLLPPADVVSASPRSSSTPLISPSQRQELQSFDSGVVDGGKGGGLKTATRRLLGLGKTDVQLAQMEGTGTAAPDVPPHTSSTVPAMRTSSPSKVERKPPVQPIPVSPSRYPYQQHAVAASPSRLQSQSPRLHSPASSEIFERNVQEPVPISTLGSEMTPAHIPSHVMTEDHIPAALEASVEAITSEELTPDEVEIVTSTAHQPAAAAVLDGSASHADLPSLHSPSQPSLPPTLRHEASEQSDSAASLHQSGVLLGADDETASNYAQLDPNDVRRLSFISFKDIVQSEHQQMAASHLGDIGSRDSVHTAGLPSGALPERTASPLRSPRSPTSPQSQSLSGGVATPPSATFTTTLTSVEQSPVRAGAGPGIQHGELTIETMGQALRKTASRDLTGVRSAGMSPTATESTSSLRDLAAPPSRTNT